MMEPHQSRRLMSCDLTSVYPVYWVNALSLCRSRWFFMAITVGWWSGRPSSSTRYRSASVAQASQPAVQESGFCSCWLLKDFPAACVAAASSVHRRWSKLEGSKVRPCASWRRFPKFVNFVKFAFCSSRSSKKSRSKLFWRTDVFGWSTWSWRQPRPR